MNHPLQTRWRRFSLSHRMGEGRGEGSVPWSSVLLIITLSLLCSDSAPAQNIPLSHAVSLATNSFTDYTLSYTTPLNASLQTNLEAIDFRLRIQYGMTTNQTAVGLLDLNSLRLAMLRPDHEEYGAS